MSSRIFHVTNDVDAMIQWYDNLFSHESLVGYHRDNTIIRIAIDGDVNGGDVRDDIGGDNDITVFDICNSDIAPFTDEERMKKIFVSFDVKSIPVKMTLYELLEINKWFLKHWMDNDSHRICPSTVSTLSKPVIWNIFMCELWKYLRESAVRGDLSASDLTGCYTWINDNDTDSLPIYGIYYHQSQSVLSPAIPCKVYFSIKAGTFFLHSITEEVHRPSKSVYLVGKLFPWWDILMNEDVLQCRVFGGQWTNVPNGFRPKNGFVESSYRDDYYAYKSRWVASAQESVPVVVNADADIGVGMDTDTSADTSADTDTSVDVESTIETTGQTLRNKIHIVSECSVLWEWIRMWFQIYMMDEPLRLYRYNMRGERSRIQYVFTKEECNELYTNLGYDGRKPYEWFSKILIECMTIRWNRYIVAEEWSLDSHTGMPSRDYIIPCHCKSRVNYARYKKARWVSRRIAPMLYGRFVSGQYYSIRILFTGFDEECEIASDDKDIRNWLDRQSDAFVVIWVNKTGDEITMNCSSPSADLLQWKQEFDYFLSQWFAVITK
jgi:hypothetical protein